MFSEPRRFNAKTILQLQFLVAFLIAESLQGVIKSVEDPTMASYIKLICNTTSNMMNTTDSAPSVFPKSSNTSLFRGRPIIDLEDFKNSLDLNATDIINTINQHINSNRHNKLPVNTSTMNNHRSNDNKFVNKTDLNEKIISKSFTHHNTKLNSYLTSLFIIGFALLSCTIYFALVIYRNYLENMYGSRELLVECDDLQKSADRNMK